MVVGEPLRYLLEPYKERGYIRSNTQVLSQFVT